MAEENDLGEVVRSFLARAAMSELDSATALLAEDVRFELGDREETVLPGRDSVKNLLAELPIETAPSSVSMLDGTLLAQYRRAGERRAGWFDVRDGTISRWREIPASPRSSSYKVRNLTGRRLRIVRGTSELLLPPLSEQEVGGALVSTYGLEQLDESNLVELTPGDAKPELDWGVVGGVAFWVGVGYLIISGNIVEDRSELFLWLWWPISAAVLLGAAGLAYYIYRRRGVSLTGRAISQGVSLLLLLAIGAGIPLAVAYRFGDGDRLLREGSSLALLARIEVTALVIIASVLPGLLFFVFDRERLSTLRRRFEQQVFRFDPLVETMGDVEARYGSQIDEFYGLSSRGRSGRLAPGTRSPIFLATLAITLGWLLTLHPANTPTRVTTPGDVQRLLVPEETTVIAGFLGAYYFAVTLIIRRYVRGDLKPKAYSAIAVRILVVFILAWVLDFTFGASLFTLLVAFFAGIVPEWAIAVLRERVRRRRTDRAGDEHVLPLTDLEGIDLYDRYRLEDEGVVNVQALVHHDLVELMLATRIPVPRLVDWVDQGILRLHVGGGVNDVASDEAPFNRSGARRDLARLGALGIRTATGLERTCAEARLRGDNAYRSLLRTLDGEDEQGSETGAIPHGNLRTGRDSSERSPATEHAEPRQPVYRFEVVLDALKDAEWMTHLRFWRSRRGIRDRVIRVGADGAIEDWDASDGVVGRMEASADGGEPAPTGQAPGPTHPPKSSVADGSEEDDDRAR